MRATVDGLPSLERREAARRDVALDRGLSHHNLSAAVKIAPEDPNATQAASSQQKSPDSLDNGAFSGEFGGKDEWRPQRDLNPCRQRERLVS